MNPKYRLVIPVALAVAAAAANFVLLKRATATTTVLVLADDVPAGRPIAPADLKPAEVRADPDVIAAAYPAAKEAELLRRSFRRDLKKGELVLHADVDVDAHTFAPRAGERAGELLIRKRDLPVGLVPNAPVEIVVRWSGGSEDGGRTRTLGPFRYMGEKTEPTENGKEVHTRMYLAAADIQPLNDFKAAVSDRVRLDAVISIQQVGEGAPKLNTGTRGAARPQPARQ